MRTAAAMLLAGALGVAEAAISNTSVSFPPVVPISSVSPTTRQFIDEAGQTRFLRGMSVAYKATPWIPLTESFDPILSFSQVDIDLFHRLNLNLIRLAVPWAAVQPKPGPDGFDEAYLAQIVDLVHQCEKAGIYVLIEAHQDLYSERFCGNGMPAWSIARDRWTLPFPWPTGWIWASYKNPDSYPSDNTCGPCNTRTRPDWGKFYGSDAVSRAFYGLYTDEKVQAPFVAYWEKLAHTFKGKSNVIGYELINEPFVASRTCAGVPYNLWRRSQTERKHLQPLYDRLTKAIRAIDQRTMIWWEPVTGGGADSGEGFKSVPAGDKEKSVMSFHSYGPNLIDGHTVQRAVELRLEQIKRLGGGLVMTEWDCEYARGLGRIRQVMELCDENMISWIGWQYKEFVHVAGSPPSGTLWNPKTGKLRPQMLKLFSRPYPSSVAGTVAAYHFDWKHHVFTMTYTPIVGGGWTTLAINEDKDAGWTTWVIHLSRESGAVDMSTVEIERDVRSIRVKVKEGWKEGTLSLKLSPIGGRPKSMDEDISPALMGLTIQP